MTGQGFSVTAPAGTTERTLTVYWGGAPYNNTNVKLVAHLEDGSSALGDLDVREHLSKIRVPTLVLRSRGDAVVPMKDGIELAAGIAGARFVALDSDNHVLLETEPAWARFDRELGDFLREIDERA